SDLPGEHAWPTQPFPSKPAPFARQSMTADSLAELTAASRDAALRRLDSLRHGALYIPPSRRGTVVLPGFDGGGEWGGAAVDPATATLFVNASDVPWIAAMRESAHVSPLAGGSGPETGAAVYAISCAKCHGADRRGRDGAPPLNTGT